MRLHSLLLAAAMLAAGAPDVSAREHSWHPVARFEHLAPVDGARVHYVLWAALKGHYQAAGAFRIDDAGNARVTNGAAPASFKLGGSAPDVREFFVTQETGADLPALPSKQVFLRGPVRHGRAVLEAPIRAADFARATGAFVLDDPVTVNDPDDFNGIWFSRFVSRRYAPALELPEAPDGWMYEGWVLYHGIPLRTGKFRTGVDSSDWDGYSGRSGASELINMGMPPMPGQDFLVNLPAGVPSGHNSPDLSGASVIVSLENATLAGEETYPSPIRVFEGQVPTPARHNETYPLVNVTSTRLPAGTVTLP